MDWWKIYHKTMVELNWTPEQLGRLTLPQLACLGSERTPGAAPRLTSKADWDALDARRRREAEEWAS